MLKTLLFYLLQQSPPLPPLSTSPHPLPLPPPASLPHQSPKINLRLHAKAITNRHPTPPVPPPRIRAGLQQRPDTLQLPIRRRIVQRRVPVLISRLQQVIGCSRSRARAAGRRVAER